MQPYDQPTSAPVPKVAAAGVAGAATSIVLWGVNAIWHIDVPAEVGAALATVIAFIAAYFTRDVKPEKAVDIIQKG